eukprot:9290366-Ditylum_brightwellii.AAC.1
MYQHPYPTVCNDRTNGVVWNSVGMAAVAAPPPPQLATGFPADAQAVAQAVAQAQAAVQAAVQAQAAKLQAHAAAQAAAQAAAPTVTTVPTPTGTRIGNGKKGKKCSESRAEQRKVKNREFAKRSRDRKKLLQESLEAEVRELQEENDRLRGLVRKTIPDKAQSIIG